MEKKYKYKRYYDVYLECLLPATLTYRVLAEDPQQAVEIAKTISPNSVKYKLIGKKDTKISVYEGGCTILRFIKNFFRG